MAQRWLERATKARKFDKVNKRTQMAAVNNLLSAFFSKDLLEV